VSECQHQGFTIKYHERRPYAECDSCGAEIEPLADVARDIVLIDSDPDAGVGV